MFGQNRINHNTRENHTKKPLI